MQAEMMVLRMMGMLRSWCRSHTVSVPFCHHVNCIVHAIFWRTLREVLRVRGTIQVASIATPWPETRNHCSHSTLRKNSGKNQYLEGRLKNRRSFNCWRVVRRESGASMARATRLNRGIVIAAGETCTSSDAASRIEETAPCVSLSFRCSSFHRYGVPWSNERRGLSRAKCESTFSTTPTTPGHGPTPVRGRH